MDLAQRARAEISRYQKLKAAKQSAPAQVSGSGVPMFDIEDAIKLQASGFITSTTPRTALYDGQKFFGGFGSTKVFITDYWELRRKSAQIFKENLYGRGIIRRYVTNIINTGLFPESIPDETILGLEEDALTNWSEDVETRFNLWGSNPEVCDFYGDSTFAKIQRTAFTEALVDGDVLVVLRYNEKTQMPYVQLVNASKVQTPGKHNIPKTSRIVHGVEIDKHGRQVAYWVRQQDGSFKRLARYGSRGRMNAFLYYATDKRMDEVRGEPLLAIVLQSLKEIDRYRDSVQRKAVINSMLAMVVTKKEDKLGTKPITGGAVRRDQVAAVDGDGAPRTLNVSTMIPGVVVDELQQGEEIKGFGSEGIDLDFAKFEEAIVQAMSWCLETPPEILRLAFSNNYSASQAAINEYKVFLNLKRQEIGSDLCSPVYVDWFISETLNKKIVADGFLDAWRDPTQYEVFGAWIASDWSGAIKPSTDMLKTVKAYALQVQGNFISQDRATREVSGMKFTKVVKRNKKANELIAESIRPLLEIKKEYGQSVDDSVTASASISDALKDENFIETIAERAVEILANDA